MTPIICAKPSPPRERSPSSPTLHVPSNIPSTSISMPSAISWNAASQSSSSSAESQPASKRPPEITGPSSLSQPSSYGCDKCPHSLEQIHAAIWHCRNEAFECAITLAAAAEGLLPMTPEPHLFQALTNSPVARNNFDYNSMINWLKHPI